MLKENDIRSDDTRTKQLRLLKKDIAFLHSKKKYFLDVNCPACGAKNKKVCLEKNGFSYKECHKCGMLYLSPRPPIKVIKEFLRKSVNYEFFEKVIFPESREIRRKKLFIPRVETVIKYCKKHKVKTDKILEIGSGHGIFCEEMKKKKFFKEIVGLEASNSLFKTCQKMGFRMSNAILEEYNSDEKFDCVVAYEVLEHVFNPKVFLKKIYELLTKKGIVMLTFPNYRGFDLGVLGVASKTLDHDHLNYFTAESISLLLKKLKFKILSLETPGKLDVELVKKAILSHEYRPNSFIDDLCVKNFEALGVKFQNFLAENKLSTHMQIVAQKRS